MCLSRVVCAGVSYVQVSRKQLALLEFVMKSCKREDTALMARRRCGNMSTAPSGENPFEKAVWFLKRRQVSSRSTDYHGRHWAVGIMLSSMLPGAPLHAKTALQN